MRRDLLPPRSDPPVGGWRAWPGVEVTPHPPAGPVQAGKERPALEIVAGERDGGSKKRKVPPPLPRPFWCRRRGGEGRLLSHLYQKSWTSRLRLVERVRVLAAESRQDALDGDQPALRATRDRRVRDPSAWSGRPHVGRRDGLV